MISVVTPCYNHARFVERTLRSVLNQDYPGMEYIVIDGGSTDGSADIVRRYESQLAFWCSEKDEGQSDALRKGFEKATGQILCWLNSDDVLFPGALKAVGEYFRDNPGIDILSAGGYYIDEQDRPLWSMRFGLYTLGVPATWRRFLYYGMDGVLQQATFWRREVYQRSGGVDPTLYFAMDLDLFTRMAETGRVGRLPRLLSGFRLHSECKSVKDDAVRVREVRLLRRKYYRWPWSYLAWPWFFLWFRVQSVARKYCLYQGLRLGLTTLNGIRMPARWESAKGRI